MIIQNAIKIIDNNKEVYLISKHIHDFVSYTFEDGKSVFIDGGSGKFAYLRRGGDFKDSRIEDFCLTDDNGFSIIKDKLLWGTRGKNGDEELTFKPLKDLDKEHLGAILETQNVSELYREVINYWIERNNETST